MSAPMSLETPGCGIAFKEWEGICAALGSGRQSIILRKGGISEGPGGFVPEHPEFWLYPTRTHQAEQGLNDELARPIGEPDDAASIPIRWLARVGVIHRVEEAEKLPELAPFHMWTEETVAKRFAYRNPGLWVLLVRIFAVREPRRISRSPGHAGCKTWVPLEFPLPTRDLEAVLDDATHERLIDRLEDALGVGRGKA